MTTDSVKYLDAHSHLNFDHYNSDREDVIAQMREDGIGTIAVGVDKATSQAVTRLAADNPHIWAVVGVHPTDTDEGFDAEFFGDLVSKDEVVGVGECGLDYYHEGDEQAREVQRRAFEAQIQFAIDHDLPLMLHVRPQKGSMDAYRVVIDILREYKKEFGAALRGNVHFFVGDTDVARDFLMLDFHLSFTGIVTFDRSVDEVIAYTPEDRYLIETDAPFAAPEPHRGKRNSPRYLPQIVSAIAEIRDISPDRVRYETLRNTTELFNIS